MYYIKNKKIVDELGKATDPPVIDCENAPEIEFQLLDAAGVRCDMISAGVVDFAPVHPEYSERKLLAEAMEELGLRLYRPGPVRYSKLRIIEELGELWPNIRAAMSDTECDKFFGADYLERGREDVESFIAKITPLVGDIEARLARCEI